MVGVDCVGTLFSLTQPIGVHFFRDEKMNALVATENTPYINNLTNKLNNYFKANFK